MAKTHWGFDTRDIDKSVRPQDDFYRYAHGRWLKKTKIPANEARWGTFTILRVETEKRLKKIVTSLGRGRLSSGSPEQMIRDFYRSGMDEIGREKLGLAPLVPWLAQIETFKNTQDILTFFATSEKYGFGGLWGILIDQDAKNSERYALHLHQSGLGLPDRDYYLKKDPESKRIRTAYERYIESIHRLIGRNAEEAQTARKTIMRIETVLATVSMTKEDLRDSEKVYHKFSRTALARLTPEIDWATYFGITGGGREREVIVMQPKFLKAVSKILTRTPIEDWRSYTRFHIVSGSASALSKKFVKAQFEFYGKTLTGNKKMKPLWRRALSATNGSLGELLGQLYVKKYFTPTAKKRVNELVDDLVMAYAKRITKLDWMSKSTKKKALLKLKMVSRKIGYPHKWKSYKGLEVRSNDYFGNLLRSAVYEHRRALKKLGKPIDRSEWHMYPQTVNAYCNFNMNEVVFPAAILQPPFFSLTADDAVNYGCIGSVIGHEITHAFDDQGSKFDGKGNMKSWWTKEDRKRFTKKARVIRQQYDTYRVADDVPVNGQLTLGENIADLGGISIAYDAYQRHRVGKKREVIDGFSPEQRFFLACTIFDLALARPEFEKMLVLTDPHSPTEFRVNGPLSNLPEFYTAFDVKKGDKLYRAQHERAKVW